MLWCHPLVAAFALYRRRVCGHIVRRAQKRTLSAMLSGIRRWHLDSQADPFAELTGSAAVITHYAIALGRSNSTESVVARCGARSPQRIAEAIADCHVWTMRQWSVAADEMPGEGRAATACEQGE